LFAYNLAFFLRTELTRSEIHGSVEAARGDHPRAVLFFKGGRCAEYPRNLADFPFDGVNASAMLRVPRGSGFS
jgi:hypothetical protein